MMHSEDNMEMARAEDDASTVITPPLPTFMGREIKTQLVAAIEAIPEDDQIVTLKAGENMLITCAFVSDKHYEESGYIPEYAWDGEKWRWIGML